MPIIPFSVMLLLKPTGQLRLWPHLTNEQVLDWVLAVMGHNQLLN